jgi:hypothetical protein
VSGKANKNFAGGELVGGLWRFQGGSKSNFH